jgi:hypothetical protein
MATVTKDFRVKNGLIVEGANGTINNSDIVTADKVTGGSKSGIEVTYNSTTKKVDFDVNDPVITISGDVDGSATIVNLTDTNIEVTLDTVNSTTGSFGGSTKIPTFTVNGKGLVTAAGEVDVATNLSIAGDTGTDTVSLLTDTLTVSGGEGVDVAVTNNTITVSGEDASTTNKGVAQFSDASFDVAAGVVTVKADGIANSMILNDNITVGTTNISLGATASSLAGLQQLDVDNIRVNENTISSTNADGNIVLNPDGTGAVDVSFARIVNVGTPTEATDAVTKGYVDSVVEGLTVHEAVVVATTENIDLATGGLLLIDGVQLVAGDRVLVKDQTLLAENGIYVAAVGAWTRAEDYDSPTEIAGGDFVYVIRGTTYAGTGWVQVDNVGTVGTDPVEWSQFSGAGTFTAGVGLDLNGTEFVLNLSEVSTTELPEGDKLYYTDERVDDRVAALIDGGKGITASYDDDGNLLTLSAEFSEFDTSDVVEDPEGTGTSGTLYFTNARAVAALEAVVPDFTAVEINSLTKQVAATADTPSGVSTTVYEWPLSEYKSAKFLVKLKNTSHTEVSEVLLTTDTLGNVALTEYAIVGTNGTLGTVTADNYEKAGVPTIRLTVTAAGAGTTAWAAGTLLV